MAIFGLKDNEELLVQAAARCRDRGIVIPTFAQMEDPSLIPDSVTAELSGIGLWDVHPRNLFRITWKNEPVPRGGGFGRVNYLEIPRELSGVRARIIGLTGKWFPTGAHKVGATFGCLVPRLVTGNFDPAAQRAVWPSTGNYCRGGAYVSSLLACESIAILPEEMSRERFEWLRNLAGEVIATPGSESNVKEIFDACARLSAERDDVVILNQFDEPGNHLWHYCVTGSALSEVLRAELGQNQYLEGIVLSSGSGGTLGCADRLKELYPEAKLAVAEALQCPTLLANGYGAHRIEGIGDKHVPWIHNLRNTDTVIGVDDELTIRLMRLLNEPAGRRLLAEAGVPSDVTRDFGLLGISSIGNLAAAVKFAKYYELGGDAVIVTIFTDSMELYGSRLSELTRERGAYSERDAVRDFEAFRCCGTDAVLELGYAERRRIHNLKYFTWIEQQGKTLEELDRQWYDYRRYWGDIHDAVDEIDERIGEFNRIIEEGV